MATPVPAFSEQYVESARNPYKPGEFANPGTPLFEMVARLTFTAVGVSNAASGDMKLLRLPPGKIRIRPDLSIIECPDATATSDLDIGVAAYTSPSGATVNADHAGLAASLDAGGGPLSQALSTVKTGYVVNSKDGADVVCSFDTENSPASGTMILRLVYQRESA